MLNSIKSLCPKNQKDLHFKILDLYRMASKKYPKYFTAFDFVSFEDTDHLDDYSQLVDEYFKNENDFKPVVCYHAGESFSRKNKNCFKAAKLGSKRLGHGLNLLRNPKAIEIIKQKGITVEVCPLSNILLGYVNDLNWHPAKFLKEMDVKMR